MQLSIITLAIILGAFFSLDLLFSKKEKGSFVRSLIVLLTVSVPAIYKGALLTEVTTEENWANLWMVFFYPTFCVVIVITFLVTYFCTYKPIVDKYNNINNLKILTFFDFIFNGYRQFKIELESYSREIIKESENYKKGHLSVLASMDKDLRNFVHEIYLTLDSETETDGYVTYFLSEFINVFFGKSNARFTFRKLSEDGKYMDAILTTSSQIPSRIPLGKRNLISQSAKMGIPLIYSKNKHFHHKTPNDSHGNSFYDDYVSYCLLENENGTPYISLSLDVKGEMAKKRMHALVDASIYQIICQLISIKILKDNEQI
jgi:hypothetical protein